MNLVHVDSTAVYAFGYDDEQHTLDVVFYRSGVYRYFDVPKVVFDNWLEAESKGRYLRQALIGNYAYERLRPKRKPEDQVEPGAESLGQPTAAEGSEPTSPEGPPLDDYSNFGHPFAPAGTYTQQPASPTEEESPREEPQQEPTNSQSPDNGSSETDEPF